MTDPELIQFRYSHFNEKVRWALDYKGIVHKRRTVYPGLQAARVRRISGQRKVPVLLMDGKVIYDSTRIIAALEDKYPNPALYPNKEDLRNRALELETFFDEELGSYIRDVMFYIGMDNPGFVARCFAGHRGFLFKRFYTLLLTMNRGKIKKYLNLSPETFTANCEKIRQALVRLDAERQENGFLVGDSFTVADLTAASLFSPIARASQNPHQPEPPFPKAYIELTESFDGPGLAWVRDIYAKYRGDDGC